MQLNRFIALSGVCSRRRAVELIEEGAIKVNNRTERHPGYRVTASDKVYYGSRPLVAVADMVYVALNKPAGFVTTRSDELGRPTVFDLCADLKKFGPRMFPVGRLDRDSKGLLLLTNDGDLAHKLAHPSFNISKKYRVVLNVPLTEEYRERLLQGVHLADGMARCDGIYYVSPDHTMVEVVLHSGKNRIVRRMFAFGDFHVRKLTRVAYAGLILRGIPQGRWRMLTKSEAVYLQKIAS